MKINRLLTAALITLATVLTSCVKESVWDRKTGIDESKAAPEEFTYDESLSSKTSLAVYWDGKKAIDAGAQSFFVQLTDKDNMDKGNSWDSNLTKVVAIDKAHNVTFTKLTQNARYFVRIRANYPGSVYSPWVYLSREDGSPALYAVGSGAVPVIPSVTLRAYVSEIEVTWTYCDAVKYEIEYKKKTDAAWSTPAEATATSYTITGLAPETEYDVRVTSITANEARYTSEVATIKTAAESPFPMSISTAQQWMEFVNGDAAALANNGTNDIVNITADLDFTGIEYATATDFKGVVNGNNKTFKNLKASTPLFKNVTSVKDLTLDATCSFTTTTSNTLASVAETSRGLISNVTNNATVTLTTADIDTYVVGGLVVYAYGDIENSTNKAAVKVATNAPKSGVVGGLVAYTEAKVNSSVNMGDVTVDIESLARASKTAVGSCSAVAVSIGGVVGLAQGDGTFEMNNCENKATVTYDVADITVSATYERNQIGGVVGSPNGLVKECKNTGSVVVNYYTPTRAALTTGNIICVGGIGGGDYYATAQTPRPARSATDYINCVNEGAILVDADPAGSNSTVGGTVGWPGVEDPVQVCITKNCINRGNITLMGAMKGRFGGIQGGAGHIEGCENYGNILANGLDKGSPLGGVAGYSSYNFTFKNNKADCSITAETVVESLGGLIGAYAGQSFSGALECKSKVVLNGTADQVDLGVVLGQANGSGVTLVFGSEADPIEVSGSVNGTVLTESNYADFLRGNPGNKWNSANHKIYAVYGE